MSRMKNTLLDIGLAEASLSEITVEDPFEDPDQEALKPSSPKCQAQVYNIAKFG